MIGLSVHVTYSNTGNKTLSLSKFGRQDNY
jgi:hypothetical protein